MNKINPCLWFDHQAEEAAKFYTSIFKNSKIGRTARYGKALSEASGQKEGSVMTVDFEIEGQKVVGLNGGPIFQFTPALSFFVWCDSEKEIDTLWASLSKGGKPRMELDKYPWAPKYGWTADKYGVEWQLILASHKQQKVAPALLFVDKLFGKGEEAINFYSGIFKNSKVETMVRDEKAKTVMHSVFSLSGHSLALMEGEGEHGFQFSEAFSLMVNCDTQEEIDHFWEKLSKGGSPGPCGWLKDKYGVSWQIVPTILDQMAADSNPAKIERAMVAMLEMEKLDIKALERAYNG